MDAFIWITDTFGLYALGACVVYGAYLMVKVFRSNLPERIDRTLDEVDDYVRGRR